MHTEGETTETVSDQHVRDEILRSSEYHSMRDIRDNILATNENDKDITETSDSLHNEPSENDNKSIRSSVNSKTFSQEPGSTTDIKDDIQQTNEEEIVDIKAQILAENREGDLSEGNGENGHVTTEMSVKEDQSDEVTVEGDVY